MYCCSLHGKHRKYLTISMSVEYNLNVLNINEKKF
jgi:hypothetical protein